jgi:hypothetical protein
MRLPIQDHQFVRSRKKEERGKREEGRGKGEVKVKMNSAA